MKSPTKLLVLAALLLSSCAQAQPAANDNATSHVRYVEPSTDTGTSMVAVVEENTPLAHTAQFFPLNQDGQLVGAGNAAEQIDRVLENLRLALREVDAGFDNLVRVHVYAAQNDVVQQVKDRFAQMFTGGVKPTVSFVVGHLPHENALVAMDAVATAPDITAERVTYHHAPDLYGAPARGHVAVMPPGGKVYFSGQVAEGDLLTATGGTMQSLFATLAYLGLSAEDVVQLKAFMGPIADADAVEEKMRSFFNDELAPRWCRWSGTMPTTCRTCRQTKATTRCPSRSS